MVYIAGYLADPARRYPSVFSSDGFFGRFPFILPSLLAAVITIIVLIVGRRISAIVITITNHSMFPQLLI